MQCNITEEYLYITPLSYLTDEARYHVWRHYVRPNSLSSHPATHTESCGAYSILNFILKDIQYKLPYLAL